MHSFSIPYGEKQLSISIPDFASAEVADCGCVRPSPDSRAEIKHALDHPVGSLPVEKIVQAGQRVCIISDDITRFTPTKIILAELLPRLLSAGIQKKDIFIVMALGSHRYMTQEEMIEKVGPDIYRNYEVINSEFRDSNGLIDMGQTPTGATVRVTKRVMESDIRIGIGNIVPHPAMGWSGGGKILYPGVTSEDTVEQFHLQQGLANDILFGMDECPVRLEVEKWVDTIGLHFIINTILTADLQLYRAVAGHYVQAQRQGVVYAKEVCGAKLDQPAQVVVVSSYPVDIDYWQATKGFLCGARGAQEGGTIILVTPCPEGAGPHSEYFDHIGNDNAEAILHAVQRGAPCQGDLLALCVGTCVMKIRKRFKLYTVSDGLTAAQLARAGVRHYAVSDLNQAVSDACAPYTHPRVLIIPHGGETVLYQ